MPELAKKVKKLKQKISLREEKKEMESNNKQKSENIKRCINENRKFSVREKKERKTRKKWMSKNIGKNIHVEPET